MNNDQDSAEPPDDISQQEEQRQNGSDVIMSNSNIDKEVQPSTEEPEDRIQILDLQSSNPIISYQNQIYSCEWTSTIGTDVILSTPDPQFPHPILKEEPGVSVVATTGIKLFGRPAKISSRPSASTEIARPQASTSALKSPVTVAADSQAPPVETPKPVKIPTSLGSSKARENQARFLERLITIKAAKGEKDEVTVYAEKVNQRSGWRSQHKAIEERREAEQAAAAGGEGDADNDGNQPSTLTAGGATTTPRGRGKVGRPRRSHWRKYGPRTQKGGLFRDYRPQLFDTEGADIRNGPSQSATPDRWEQLHQQQDQSTSPSHSNNANDDIDITTLPLPSHPQASTLKTAPAADPHHSIPLDPSLTLTLQPPPPATMVEMKGSETDRDGAIESSADAPSLEMRSVAGAEDNGMIHDDDDDGNEEMRTAAAADDIAGGREETRNAAAADDVDDDDVEMVDV